MWIVAWGLLKQFWRPILLIVIFLAVWGYGSYWLNSKINAAYDRGYSSAFQDLEREEQRIIRRSEEISQENARELNFLLNQQEIKREVVYEQVNTYIREHTSSCTLSPEYLSLWDDATASGSSKASNDTGITVGTVSGATSQTNR